MTSPEKSAENLALTSLLYEALAEPIGLLVATADPDRLRQRLYQLRTLADDPELERLQIAASPIPGGELVIVKTKRPETSEKAQANANLEDLLG